MKDQEKKLTTASGRPYYENENSMTVSNIVSSMKGIEGPLRDVIINRQICHFFRADVQLGMGVAKELGVDIGAVAEHMPAQAYTYMLLFIDFDCGVGHKTSLEHTISLNIVV